MKVFSKKTYFSNCLIEAIRLKLKFGKRIKIKKLKKHFHFYCESVKSGTKIHFHHINDRTCILLFKGKLEVRKK